MTTNNQYNTEFLKKSLNIIFTIDKSYIQHFTVALISLIENNKDIDLKVFVIHDIDNSDTLQSALNFFIEKYNISIVLLSLENALFDNYKITHHVSKATYFRLMIADIIPDNIDTAIFLDSDIVINASLAPLSDIDFGDKYLFAVNDTVIEQESIKRLNKLEVPADKYFNAGVMLLNLKTWRDNGVSEKLILIAQKYMDKLVWWDQDVLNICFFDRWGKLDVTYNTKDIYTKTKNIPVIIHYAGSSKPWHYINNHPYKKLYWNYLKLSPFKDFSYMDFSVKKLIKKIIFFNRSL